MDPLLAFLICLILFLFSYLLKLLDAQGSITAFFFGLIILLFSSIQNLILLIYAFFLGSLFTKVGIERKKKHAGKYMRSFENVFSNGVFPAISAFLGMNHVFLATTASFLADTTSSELGTILCKEPRMITNFKKVKAGEDGAVSIQGTSAAILASASLGALAFLLGTFSLATSLILTIFSGFIGDLIDSLIGATLQRRWLTNAQTNLLSNFIVALIIMGVWTWIC